MDFRPAGFNLAGLFVARIFCSGFLPQKHGISTSVCHPEG